MKKLVLWMMAFGMLAGGSLHAQDAPAPAPTAMQKIAPMAADADPSFDVATIKPNNSGDMFPQGIARVRGARYDTQNVCLVDLIRWAYSLQEKQIVGAPDWAGKDRYDILATMQPEGKPSLDQLRIMIQKLLADRFQLKFHQEKRTLSVYVMTTTKNGPRMKLSDEKNPMHESERDTPGGVEFTIGNLTTKYYAEFLQYAVLDRPVVDQTGLTGKYDFDVTFMPDDSVFGGRMHVPPEMASAPNAAPSFLEAIQQYLGLKLTAVKIPTDVLVIDKAEQPSAN